MPLGAIEWHQALEGWPASLSLLHAACCMLQHTLPSHGIAVPAEEDVLVDASCPGSRLCYAIQLGINNWTVQQGSMAGYYPVTG
jgi:hypothetical protein